MAVSTSILQLAGAAQLALAAGSLAIPRVLGWRADLARVRRLTRQVFWVYAGYIWATNVAFGLLSLLAPGALLAPGPLGRVVAAYVACYWGARLALQPFLAREDAPDAAWTRVAEALLLALFAGLTAVYGAVALGASP